MTCTLGFTIASTVEAYTLPGSPRAQLCSNHYRLNTLEFTSVSTTSGTAAWTDSLIDVLVIYAVNTGVLTCILGLLGFIFAVVTPDNFIYIGLSIVGVKMYANSVLAVLNCRRSLSDCLHAGFEMGSFEPNFALSGNRIDARKLQQPTPVSLTVSTEMVFAPGAVHTQDGSTGSETTAASQAEHDKLRASTRSLV
ncbi:uncharacterized protein TRAVEDRAFT_53583 [Trametes versicolor FP-101664 SS1]|uniref:uncharacterized protein n=1 Tax=Trametes versicolor (strain FP-101664) TaxID=717944 RepID=UPI0004623045|nr:uncharacterized protein TRAVEDRAFT_53583 [Trametes versicolor FP-101664 SS1]EIW52155.1 hypothetical protein TRAVEDRAFT_53583 [Trametes versicolor FP-101664 SS1]